LILRIEHESEKSAAVGRRLGSLNELVFLLAGIERELAHVFQLAGDIDDLLPLDNRVRGVQITPCTTIADNGWNTATLSLYSHCGTHMDAPKHFLGDDAATIDQQSLAVCCGPAKIIDLTPVEPRELITVARLCERLASVEPGDRLLLRTDWSKRLGTPEYRDALPRISLELARWLVERRVALIGVEPPSVADVNDLREVTEVHLTLFRGNVVILEGLTNLDQLQKPVGKLIALPLRIVAGDGSPVRAIAIEE
jgi:kynurenine formamidase